MLMALVSELDCELEDELRILLLVSACVLDASDRLDICRVLDVAAALDVGLLAGGAVDSSFAAPPHAVK